MGVLKELQKSEGFTEGELSICSFILKNPEKIAGMSTRDLGMATFTSKAAITRFCRKIGCDGYNDFKLKFASEIKSINLNDLEEQSELSERDNIVSIINKVSELQRKVIEETKQEFSLEQLVRIGNILEQTEYIDFYVYDMNVNIAQYGCNQLFHCGKIANTYIATNVQQLLALRKLEKHLAIIISNTGENSRLIEVAKSLKKNKVKTIVITADRKTTLGQLGDEFLHAVTTEYVEGLQISAFSTSVKYILDVLFCLTFTKQFETNLQLNRSYEKIGKSKLWALLPDM
ncbi:DNA-binding MurR/RpiR family transcriptional regulator [Clostridium saccharoperbutylacetonicum]|jgi:Transcriptional regulators|uniref:Transcriptional regulator, RpiR family n=1 Tax=Clostridium saccharoperbutylacetonicum N1-4(HMT) TaxID=931276 RepID=M1MGP0_9CLOT|nr:MurR/RpiR family transcriptional regulator [Clostridium saccharoperbutylacetonicum]AGF55513.1 transcriptional regulator, RpiR family [Clostridium saccharoperbutylacetonicum N1-4(HMT)]NRT63768.1 DNA-binding MurR/RpiR family transcriptional regulator [Clostridium saccharoperbutylacetonicum]NSB27131.1 DNA-binding MurR/RpiR family transcriptional regulator [Clostridium saccharoperbutylacetonicum]NSB40617.1 DNA-binding MurR/RpiR family transcriptional regulator [Clostridium saccharoperbutylaceton